MGIFDLLLIALGLSMDAFAVSICKGLSLQKIKTRDMLRAGMWFGAFQGFMPMIGYQLGRSFYKVVDSFDHWLAFILLALIGINMIRESLSKADENQKGGMDIKSMLILAIATSIDALAVGVTFAFVPVAIFGISKRFIATIAACVIIGIITFVMSAAGVKIGGVFGGKFRQKAEFAGGVILLGIGLKILLQGIGVI